MLIRTLLLLSVLISCTAAPKKKTETAAANSAATKLPLEKIQLPPGFHIEVFAENVENARSLCLTPGGTLFVGSMGAGKVYALRDTDGDMHADEQYVIASGLQMPNGVAFRDGSLYVAEVSRILR